MKVNVPKFAKKSPFADLTERELMYHTAGRKKPGYVIREEMREEEESFELPPSKVKELGEKEKHKLAAYMEWNGKPPEFVLTGVPKVKQAAPAVAKTEKEELEDMFDSISHEIEERRSFIEDMVAIGKGKGYEHQIKGEISTRVKELKALDERIRAM